MKRIVVALTFVVLATFPVVPFSATPRATEPRGEAGSTSGLMRYGFIHSNVTCLTKPKQSRVKLVSQIFEFCPLEVPSRQIISDNEIFRTQVAQTVCESEFDVTYESVVSDSSEDRLENDHKAALRDTSYSKHQQWHASVEYPTNKCR